MPPPRVVDSAERGSSAGGAFNLERAWLPSSMKQSGGIAVRHLQQHMPVVQGVASDLPCAPPQAAVHARERRCRLQLPLPPQARPHRTPPAPPPQLTLPPSRRRRLHRHRTWPPAPLSPLPTPPAGSHTTTPLHTRLGPAAAPPPPHPPHAHQPPPLLLPWHPEPAKPRAEAGVALRWQPS